MQRHNRYGMAVAAGMAFLMSTACKPSPVPAAGARIVVLLDRSASIGDRQRESWKAQTPKLVEALKPGGALLVYAIHDQTGSTAPLLEVETYLRATNGSDETVRESTALRGAREQAREGLEKAFGEVGRATSTDVFSAIDRIRADGSGRPTKVVFFSDMANSTPDLNMEVYRAVKRDAVADTLQRLAKTHLWSRDTWAGVEVLCVLTSVGSGGKAPAVDRLTLELFYRTLFEAIGARMTHFDTHLGGGLNGKTARGGRHVA